MVEHDRAAADERAAEQPERPSVNALAPQQRQALALQRAAGNRAVAQLARAGFWDRVTAFFTGDYVATVKGEKVLCKTEAEESEAGQIIDRIESNYGVDVSSVKSMKALQTRYSTAPKEMLDKLKTRPWLFKELRATERALRHFSKVLGLRRAFSTRKDAPQEIVSVGKMEQKFGPKAGKYEWRPTVMGEYFKEENLRAFTMYKHGETATPDFPGDTEKQMEATAVHEIAHGVFRYAIPGFIADNGYWLDEDTKSGTAGAEAPPTSYGNTNAREDLSETVMFYFVDPERLKKGNGATAGKPGNACPKRFAYIDALVKGWTPPPPPKPPVGDFPVRDPGATTGVA